MTSHPALAVVNTAVYLAGKPEIIFLFCFFVFLSRAFQPRGEEDLLCTIPIMRDVYIPCNKNKSDKKK